MPEICEAGRGATATEPARERFRRSELTWASYLLLGYFAYLQTIPGPVLPSLRRDLHLSYTQGGLHFSAFAAGMVAAGLVGGQAATRVGRSVMFWGGAAGMAAGALALAGPQLAVTVAGTGAMGFFGGLLLTTIQAALAQEHGPQRAQALTEANVVASAGASLAGLAVGGALGIGLGWRVPLGAAVGVLVAVALRFGRVRLPASVEQAARRGGRSRRLPPLFWVYWAAVVLGVSTEWCVNYWGADYLRQVRGLDASAAATAMGLYLGVGIGSRFAGSRLARTVGSAPLLVLAAICALAGILVFWRAPGTALSMAGLGLAGLGIANLYPLTMATALGLVPAQPDAGSARLLTGAGLAILTAPLALGAVADHGGGLRGAFAIVPVLLGAVACLAALAALQADSKSPIYAVRRPSTPVDRQST